MSSSPGNKLEYGGRILVLETPPGQVSGQIDPAAVMQLLLRSGLVLVRNYKADQSAFEALTHQFCDSFHHTAGRNTFRRKKGDGYSTWTPPFNFSLLSHAEGAFRPFKSPDVGFFHCVQPPTEPGGETMLVNGQEFYRRLPVQLREKFLQHGIIYESRWDRERWQVEFNIRESSEMTKLGPRLPRLEYRFEGDEMLCRCRGTAIQQYPDGKHVFVNALLGHLPHMTHPAYVDSRVFCKPSNRVFFGDGEPISDEQINLLLDIQDEICLDYPWNANDLLIIDNGLYMHGRRKTVADCERRISVRFGFLRSKYQGARQAVSEATL